MANLTPNNRQENWYKGIIDGSTTLTPNNRREYWYQGMIDGSTDLTPNNRREAWYKAIVDSKGGGGGSSDFTTCTMTVEQDMNLCLPIIATEGGQGYIMALSQTYPSGEHTVALYKGHCVGEYLEENTPTITGDATYIEGGILMITGDFTIALN